jgi:hypothetical protein
MEDNLIKAAIEESKWDDGTHACPPLVYEDTRHRRYLCILAFRYGFNIILVRVTYDI